MRLLGPVAIVLLTLPGFRPPAAQQDAPDTSALLDRYLAGNFDEVVTALDAVSSLQPLLDDLEIRGRNWIHAAGPAEVDRRELAAATFALEAARTGARKEWKMRIRGRGAYLYWRPPPLLLEWACALLRARELPHPHERLWQLAALSVAQRAEDFEFLVGDGPNTALLNYGREIEHLRHVRERFPDEPRFTLAQAITAEWMASPGVGRGGSRAAQELFDDLGEDPDIGAEATLRRGRIAMLARDDRRAEELFDRVESMTRDPWILYLARLFKGEVLERRDRPAEAERAYRGAAAAVPHAQAASTALATLLFGQDRRQEASRLIDEMLAASPMPVDPWRGYISADDRFWPVLIGRLRAAIR